MSVGVRTRTSDKQASRLAPMKLLRRMRSLGGLLWRIDGRLGGRADLANMPGAVRHVQSASLKAADLSRWQVLTPRLPVRHRRGCERPLSSEN